MSDPRNYSWPEPEGSQESRKRERSSRRDNAASPSAKVTYIDLKAKPQKTRSEKWTTLLAIFIPVLFVLIIMAAFIWPGVSAIQRFIWPVPVGELGKPVSYGGHTLTVNQTDRLETFDKNTAKPGMQFVFVDITYESGGDENLSSTLFFEHARLKDNSGYVYEAQSNLRKPGLADTSGVIPKGSKVRGWLTFQVPKTADGLLLDFPVTRGFDRRSPIRILVKLDGAATATVPSPSGQPVGSSGRGDQLVGQGSYLMRVNSNVVTDQLQLSPLGVRKAAAGKKYVLVELIFESKADRGVYINLNDTSLRDGDNYVYKTSGSLYYEPALPVISDLPKGYKVRGWIGFEVPATAKDFVLVYRRTSGENVNLQVTLGN
jgi:hypothetical protein